MSKVLYTLKQVKEYLRANFDKGCVCPACGQRVQLYDYKMYGTSVAALILLYKLPEDEYHHVRYYAEAQSSKPRSPHFAELRFWDLIEPAPKDDDPKKKSSGYWRITPKGREFVEGKIRFQSRILVFNNKFCGFSSKSEPINVSQALGNDFSYEELMNPLEYMRKSLRSED